MERWRLKWQLAEDKSTATFDDNAHVMPVTKKKQFQSKQHPMLGGGRGGWGGGGWGYMEAGSLFSQNDKTLSLNNRITVGEFFL